VIGVIMRIGWIQLSRDRVAQAMTFLLPILFFSIFAMVFGRASMNRMSRVRVAVADEDRSPASRSLIDALRGESALRVRESTAVRASRPAGPLTRATATEVVRSGDSPVAVVIPQGWGASFPDFGGAGAPLDVLADPSDPIAPRMVAGMLQRAAAKVLQGSLAGETGGDAATDRARAGSRPRALDFATLAQTRVTDLMVDPRRGRSMVSFYAAGIAVMFLLFSCSGAGGTLLEEQESGTLERVLGTRVGMSGLLAGKWLLITLLGTLQVVVMFTWGAVVFRLDLLDHLPGFIVMTAVTAAAAAGLGLMLATACRTRAQLSGFATILILMMSALGGSMFPRFLMSESMQKLGLLTFNGWALDGYVKVFWRDAGILELWPQLLVLAALTLVFLGVARLFARRWETA
jgi:linearmycin/streptolysin S transport system permease protein